MAAALRRAGLLPSLHAGRRPALPPDPGRLQPQADPRSGRELRRLPRRLRRSQEHLEVVARHACCVSEEPVARVLIVEDDLILGRTLVRGLREAGFEVEIAPTGEAGLAALAERPAAVMILDVVLPGIDGFETCRRLRIDDPRTPVLMLSARRGVADRVAGLEAG